MCVRVYYQPLNTGRMWHKVISKRGLTGLNLEFSFSQTDRLIKAEEHCLEGDDWIHTFLKGISTMWNAVSLVQDLNSCRRVYSIER